MTSSTFRILSIALILSVVGLAGCTGSNEDSSLGQSSSSDTGGGLTDGTSSGGTLSDDTSGTGSGSSGSTSGSGTGSSEGSESNATSGSGTTSGSSTTSGGESDGPAPVDLGTAASFVLLAKTGITTTGTTSIVGDMGVSPIAGTSITGFSLIMDSSNQFATSSLVTGKIYAADYASPTPAKLTQAIADMQSAASDASGRVDPTASELGAGAIGGMTLTPGLYSWSTGVTIGSDIVLSGGPDAIWVFQVAQTLQVASGVHVTLSGGAQADNVFWQVSEKVTLGTDSAFQGNVLGHNAIVFNTGASLTGRALAETAVTLDANSITKSA